MILVTGPWPTFRGAVAIGVVMWCLVSGLWTMIAHSANAQDARYNVLRQDPEWDEYQRLRRKFNHYDYRETK